MNLPEPVSRVVALALFALLPASAMADQGRAAAADPSVLYHDYCSVCHGDRGDGDSRARGSLVPPPRDFTAPAARELTRERIIASITDGRPGTAMTPWKEQLSASQIASIADYIRARFMAPSGGATGSRGAQLYARTCSVCHGDTGKGAVWASTNLNPRPRDFTSALAATELDRDRMLHSVTFGRPDTAMPGFGTQLAGADIEAVVDYVRTAFMRAAPATVAAAPSGGHGHGHDHGAHATGASGADLSLPFPDALTGDARRGEAFYRQNCVACHGEHGDGQGPRAYFILPKPRNFTHPAARSALNRPHLFAAIAKGRVGTEMPAWEKVLAPQDIADIAEYVLRSFIEPGPVMPPVPAGRPPATSG